ncbi:MAG: helix-turn-helix transcriptional regulator [Anaerovibrio sp.]|nr:helix-turn-helix transcriptional regulator [Anaerovibrio sp.]MBO6245930.1 helix-turn-helix transcriptional regulator [Anaerovibrio sp.]
MDIKAVIKNHRNRAGLTMKELADLVGVSEATVSRWESGNIATMKHSQIANLCKALHISPALIVPGIDYPAEPSAPDQELSDHDKNMVAAYNAAPASTQRIVDVALEPFMPKEHSDDGKADFEEEGA